MSCWSSRTSSRRRSCSAISPSVSANIDERSPRRIPGIRHRDAAPVHPACNKIRAFMAARMTVSVAKYGLVAGYLQGLMRISNRRADEGPSATPLAQAEEQRMGTRPDQRQVFYQGRGG